MDKALWNKFRDSVCGGNHKVDGSCFMNCAARKALAIDQSCPVFAFDMRVKMTDSTHEGISNIDFVMSVIDLGQLAAVGISPEAERARIMKEECPSTYGLINHCDIMCKECWNHKMARYGY